jgi:hypothetical protein
MRKNLPSIEAMRALEYSPESGIFTRQYLCKSTGYAYVRVAGQSLQAHRVVWARETGEWPPHPIDHIDCNRLNNRFANLRPCTPMQNSQNMRVTSKSKSGIKGVHWDKKSLKWGAWICVAKKRIALGRYSTIEQASEAYRTAATKHFGEFARAA